MSKPKSPKSAKSPKSPKPSKSAVDPGKELAELRRMNAALISSGNRLAVILANVQGFKTIDIITALADWQFDRDTFNHKTNE
ncbi:MAG: hypothetical protein ACK5VI_04300 [Opitutia bacterium]